MRQIVVVGAGGHGRAVAESILLARDYKLIGFLDDGIDAGTEIWGFPVLGPIARIADYRALAATAIAAIGNNAVREHLHRRVLDAGFELASVVHPAAFVSPKATIGKGCAIMAGAIVGTEASLGDGVILNSGSIVDHHCRVEAFAHLGVGACMAGGSVLRSKAWLQAGSALGYGVVIDTGVVVAPGEGVAVR